MTDVVMPEMSGKELAEEIARPQPNMNVLFMSSNSRIVELNEGVQEAGFHFIRKPFTPEDLARKVREAMGTRNAEIGARNGKNEE